VKWPRRVDPVTKAITEWQGQSIYDPMHYTHTAYFRGVPCYWHEKEHFLVGRNWFYDLLLSWYAEPLDGFLQGLASLMCYLQGKHYQPVFVIKISTKRIGQ
jgi:hypothetical protein